MPRFMLFQRTLPTSNAGSTSQPSPTQEDFATAFASWMETYGEHVSDMGGQFGTAETALPDDSTEAPANNVKGLAGGYMIVTADDLASAVEIARTFPGLVRHGSGVEVVEILEPE